MASYVYTNVSNEVRIMPLPKKPHYMNKIGKVHYPGLQGWHKNHVKVLKEVVGAYYEYQSWKHITMGYEVG